MPQKQLLFFSSDASDLYKADVFRVLALPNGYTIQFRYGRKYLLESFRHTPEKLVGREGVVFFLAGNDLSKPASERVLTPYPIRRTLVRASLVDASTDQLILILELKDYVNCEISTLTDKNELPPVAFVTEAELTDLRSAEWIHRVQAVEKHFPKVLFFRIGQVLLGTQAISPLFSSARRASFFELDEESEYTLECSCYDREGGRAPLVIRCDSKEIDLANSFESGARTRLDTMLLPLTTRTLKSRTAPASLTFYSPTHDTDPGLFKDPNFVKVGWRLRRNRLKPLLFGIFTALAAVGLVLAETSLKSDDGTYFSWSDLLVKVLGVFLVGLAGAQLFNYFNKT